MPNRYTCLERDSDEVRTGLMSKGAKILSEANEGEYHIFELGDADEEE